MSPVVNLKSWFREINRFFRREKLVIHQAFLNGHVNRIAHYLKLKNAQIYTADYNRRLTCVRKNGILEWKISGVAKKCS